MTLPAAPSAASSSAASVPPSRKIPPLKVLVPVSVSEPPPVFVNPAVPAMIELIVVLPGAWIVGVVPPSVSVLPFRM